MKGKNLDISHSFRNVWVENGYMKELCSLPNVSKVLRLLLCMSLAFFPSEAS